METTTTPTTPRTEGGAGIPVTLTADPRLSEVHEELRRTVERFARTEVAPVIADYCERGEFPYPVVSGMGALGLFGLPFPEDVGGSGGDFLASSA